MRIGVMATGAVGGYFGARLQQAGHEVVFIARGAHLDALRKDGLKIASPVGDLHLKKVTATDDPRTIGPVDIVLFAVKLWDTEKAGEQTKPLIGPDTAVITLQNGVDSVARLDPLLGTAHVVGGLTYIGSRIAGPGAIQHIGLADIRCGERDGKPSKRLLAFADAAKQAGFDFAISDNIELDLWKKFVFLVGFSGLTTVTRKPFGELYPDTDCRALFHDLMKETLAVGRARGVPLPPDFADERYNTISCLEGLEHIEQKYQSPLVATFRRALKPGGTLVISSPENPTGKSGGGSRPDRFPSRRSQRRCRR